MRGTKYRLPKTYPLVRKLVKKVLLVDDNDMARGVLVKMLRISGYETIEASTGDEAYELTRQHRPDLIISDIMMPSGDGYQFCRNVRTDPEQSKTPFIFYSAAFTSPKDVDFAYELGATRFIQKPQNPRKILEIIKELLEDEEPLPLPDAAPSSLEEPSFLKLHSERMVLKLEEKVAELEKTRTFLETVLNSMAEGLLVIDRDYTVRDANYAACTLFNLSREEIVGRKCHELLHGLGRPCGPATAVCPFPRIFDEAQSAQTTYQHTVTCAGHVLEVIASPVRDSEGNITSMVQLIRDVTERVKLEEEVSRKVKELEDFYDASVAKELRLIELEKAVGRLRGSSPEAG